MSKEKLKLSNQLCFPLYAVSRLITKTYKPYLDKLGLTYPQYLVMLVLWEKDEVPIKHITDRLLLETNTVTPLLKRMEKQGLLQRNRSESDERKVLIALTQEGRDLESAASHIPDALVKSLSHEQVELDDVMKMKGILHKWIKLLEG